MVALAALAFVGIFFFAVPFALVIIGAAAIGFAGNASGLVAFRPSPPTRRGPPSTLLSRARSPEHVRA
jgi:chromate transporter